MNLRSLVSGALLDKSPTLDKVNNILVISLTLTKLKIMRKKCDIPPPRPKIRLERRWGGSLGSPWCEIAVEGKVCSARVEEDDESKGAIGEDPGEKKTPKETWIKDSSQDQSSSTCLSFFQVCPRAGQR